MVGEGSVSLGQTKTKTENKMDILKLILDNLPEEALEAHGLMRIDPNDPKVSIIELQMNDVDLQTFGLHRTEDVQEVALLLIEASSEHIDETSLLQGCRDAGMSEEKALEALNIDPEEYVKTFIRDQNVSHGDVFDEIGLDSIKEWLLENMALKDILTGEDVNRGLEGWDLDAIASMLNDVGDDAGYRIVSTLEEPALSTEHWSGIMLRQRARLEQERNNATNALLQRIYGLETSCSRLIHDRDLLLAYNRGDVEGGDLVVRATLDAAWKRKQEEEGEPYCDHTDREAAMNEA